MFIDPSANFPLLPSDQAEVMQIFLDLMSQHQSASSEAAAANHRSATPRHDVRDIRYPGEQLDYE